MDAASREGVGALEHILDLSVDREEHVQFWSTTWGVAVSHFVSFTIKLGQMIFHLFTNTNPSLF